MTNEKKVMTKEGYEKLVHELNDIEKIQLPQVLLQIKEAREEGDLSENSDYHASKDNQALLKNRLATLKEMLSDVQILDTDLSATDIVSYGSLVDIEIENDDVYTLKIVGGSEVSTNDSLMKISFDSPIGSAIEGKRVGDIIVAKLISGKKSIKILSIK